MRRFQGVAALLFASAAGCGKTTSLSDAPTHDASNADTNTVTDATPTGDVTVITKSRCCTEAPGTLDANVPVFSVQPDGNAGPAGQTDTNGKVVLTGVKEGASITAIYTLDSTDFQLVTVLAVKPGDTITLGDSYGAQVASSTGTLNATFPPFAGASSYTVYVPCAQQNAAASPIGLAENCAVPTANVLFFALDANFTVIASGYVKGVAFTDGATAALTAWTAVPAGGFTTSITGLIDDVDEFDVNAILEADGTTTWGASGNVFPVSNNAATVNVQLPIGGDRTYVKSTLWRSSNSFGRQEMYTSVGPTATAATFPPPTLPWLGQGALVDATSGTLSWLQLGGTSYDAAYASVSWSRNDIANDTTDYYSWNILIPPGQTAFQWSSPIAALAPYLPVATDSINSNPQLQLIDLGDATGYDGTRAVPEWQWQCPGCATETGEVTGVSAVAFPLNGGEGFAPAHGRPHAPAPRAHAPR